MEEVIVTPEIVEAPIVEQAENTENAAPNSETVETKTEKTFTQSELDGIITKRLERERETTAKKVAQESRDAYVAEQGYTWNGKEIKTEAEYNQALKEQELTNQYKSKELPDDVIQELIEGKKFREQFQTKEQEAKAKAKVESDYQDFINEFPDTKPDDIPQTVWDEVNNGKSLVDAFTRHENASLKQKLAEFEQKKQIEQQNQQNAASSTGSVTGNGTVATAHFTQEQVAFMSHAEVNKNWTAINESMKKW